MKRFFGAALLCVAACGGAMANDSIPLPSGDSIKIDSFEVSPKWRESFPEKHPFFMEKYPGGNLQGMHGRESGKLEGSSVTLHENGNLKILANYVHCQRQGPFRVWNEDRQIQLYSQYKENKKDGVTCLFKNGVPWLMQEWKAGELQGESIVARSKAKDWRSIDDANQLAEAKKRLLVVEGKLKETEDDVRKNLHSWYEKESEEIKKENLKVVQPAKDARLKAEYDDKRKTDAAVVAGAHPSHYSRIGGAARAERKAANNDLKAATGDANAKTEEGREAIAKRNKALIKDVQEQYAFAIHSLEKSQAAKKKGGKGG